MDEAVIADLKQFITTTVSQQISGLEGRLTKKIDSLDLKIDQVEARVNGRIDSMSAAIARAIDENNTNFDKRLVRLEDRLR